MAVQRQLTPATVVSVNHVGNHGYREPLDDSRLNAYGFGSLPGTPTDDVRHNFTASYVFNLPYYHSARSLTDGWRLAGTIFGRSGMPLSVVDGALSAALNAQNYTGEIIASQINAHPDGLLANCS